MFCVFFCFVLILYEPNTRFARIWSFVCDNIIEMEMEIEM